MAKNYIAKENGEPNEPAVEEGNEDRAEKTKPTTDLGHVHKEALERYERGFLHDRHNVDAAYDDLRFLVDEENAQWDPKALKQRLDDGRPALTVNKCPQFVRQVTGDIRQLRPSIKCVPVDDDADDDVAEEILPGMIRYIENRSDAKGAYFTGADQMVAAGIGHLRVLTEYASEQTFNQELRVAAIADGIAVVWDPDAERPCREDALWCFVPVDMSRDSFKEQWPDCEADPLPTVPQFFGDWYTDTQIRVTEYFRKVPVKRRLASLPGGALEDVTELEDDVIAEIEKAGGKIEEREGFKVERYLLTAGEICEGPDEWPGPDIPIVPMIGEEISLGRKKMRRGVVRPLKDLARAYNYAFSLETEVIALQPKAPFIGTRKNFEKHADQWETANSKNWPYLEYEPDPANGGKQPSREPPPQGSIGLQQLMETSSADMNAVTGIYPASLGAHSNETSGKAIVARQREGDTGTYVYIENFSRGVRRVGQILVNLIPHIYDTERELRIVGEDGKHDKLAINQSQLSNDGVTPISVNDVTKGAYDVVIEMGPSYSTKREEARDGIQAFMQAAGPQVVPMFIDLFAKMQDWPLADQIAERAKLLLPPQIQAKEAADAGEQPPPPPAPPPLTPEQQMAMQQHQADMEKHQAEMAGRQGEQQLGIAKFQFDQQAHADTIALDHRKLDVEIANVNAELRKAELAHQATLHKNQLDHHAKLAGHAAAIDTADLSAQASVDTAKAEADPRVDELAQAVGQLRDIVIQLAQSMAAPDQGIPMQGSGPPGSPPPGPPPGTPMMPDGPPPGGLPMSGP